MQALFILQESYGSDRWLDSGASRWIDVGIFSTMEKAKAFAPEGAEWVMDGLHAEAVHVYRPDTILAPAWADYRILPSTLDPVR